VESCARPLAVLKVSHRLVKTPQQYEYALRKFWDSARHVVESVISRFPALILATIVFILFYALSVLGRPVSFAAGLVVAVKTREWFSDGCLDGQRFCSVLEDKKTGEKVAPKPGAEVDVTIEAGPNATNPKKPVRKA